jgi:hypothetical protein
MRSKKAWPRQKPITLPSSFSAFDREPHEKNPIPRGVVAPVGVGSNLKKAGCLALLENREQRGATGQHEAGQEQTAERD